MAARFERLDAWNSGVFCSTPVDLVGARERTTKRRQVREKAERLSWFVASVFLLCFGDGSRTIYDLVLDSAKAKRTWFLLANVSLLANICILYHLIIRHQFLRHGSKWEENVSWALPSSSVLGVMSFTGYSILLWPSFHVAAPAVLAIICMGLLMTTSFFPCLSTKTC